MIYNTEQLHQSLRGQCTPLHVDKSDCWGLAREACPGMNTKLEWQMHHNCSGCEFDGAALILTECILFVIFSAIIIITWFFLTVIIIIIMTGAGLHCWECWHMASVLVVLHSGCKQVPGGNGWFISDLQQYPHSALLFCTTDRRTTHPTDTGPWGNGSPLSQWSWVIQWMAWP